MAIYLALAGPAAQFLDRGDDLADDPQTHHKLAEGQGGIDDPHGDLQGGGAVAPGLHGHDQVKAILDQEHAEQQQDHVGHDGQHQFSPALQLVRQHIHADMVVALHRHAGAQPDLPDEHIAGQILAPGQGVVEYVTHYHLYKDQQGGKGKAYHQKVRFQRVIEANDFFNPLSTSVF